MSPFTPRDRFTQSPPAATALAALFLLLLFAPASARNQRKPSRALSARRCEEGNGKGKSDEESPVCAAWRADKQKSEL